MMSQKGSYEAIKLDEASQQRPDLLVENVAKRVKLLTEELERFNQDKEANEQLIVGKERELSTSQGELKELRGQIERAEKLMEEFLCPHCKAPMLSREFGWESVEYNGREVDVNHEYILYECGQEFVDGVEGRKCRSLQST